MRWLGRRCGEEKTVSIECRVKAPCGGCGRSGPHDDVRANNMNKVRKTEIGTSRGKITSIMCKHFALDLTAHAVMLV